MSGGCDVALESPSGQAYTAAMEDPQIPFHLANLPLPLRICLEHPMSDEELLQFCAANDVLRVEREPNGELTVTSPTGTGAGQTDSEINLQLGLWARAADAVVVFGSFTGFRLPDGSMRSPDAATASRAQWETLTPEQRRRGFAPLCPQFVIELRSPSDRLPDLQAKMGEWLRNGVQLAWLIDPERQAVEIYRPGIARPEVLERPVNVQGEGPLAGFVLETECIWQQR